MLRKSLLFAALISPLALACPPEVHASVLNADLEVQVMNNQANVAEQETVNINQASAEELAKVLKGVGVSRARAIIELRERLGGFTDIDQLLEVRGLGIRILNQNRDKIVL
ncbi:ComEA family DNA-binding protein [Aliidiomarina celeris]|uniref:ComEA family DNA-binding protein n=1 Tax=Aliidiomarina celeris TaxID=2249428 RepID=UPI000DEB9541|nr:helix-hairpin-helix domain-containing protein [Aliidiomarina celeris]